MARPGGGFVLGGQVGASFCVGWSKDLDAFGSPTGASGTELAFGHENLSPIPGMDVGIGISGDTTGAIPRPTGVQLNLAPEVIVWGSEGHIHDTRTWLHP